MNFIADYFKSINWGNYCISICLIIAGMALMKVSAPKDFIDFIMMVFGLSLIGASGSINFHNK